MYNQINASEVARTTITNRLPALELAIQSLAQAIGGKVPEHGDISEFFHDFIDGCWDPYEEATANSTEELRQADQTVRQAEHQILQALGEDHHRLLDRYAEMINNRATKELEYAFLVGYQCALRFILMGILPPVSMIRNERNTAEKGAGKNEA